MYRYVKHIKYVVYASWGDHQAWVYCASYNSSKRIPSSLVKPIEEVVVSMFDHMSCCSIIKPAGKKSHHYKLISDYKIKIKCASYMCVCVLIWKFRMHKSKRFLILVKMIVKAFIHSKIGIIRDDRASSFIHFCTTDLYSALLYVVNKSMHCTIYKVWTCAKKGCSLHIISWGLWMMDLVYLKVSYNHCQTLATWFVWFTKF